MRLAAIYTVWDDWDLMQLSIKNISSVVEGVIVIYSTISNFGEKTEPPMNFEGAISLNFDPDISKSPRENETAKRNFGLQKARELGYTHFLSMDADEFYEPWQFLKAKEEMEKHDYAGSVCRLKCYFKEPTLTVPDQTLVPFIHKITPILKHEFNPKYPFAFEGPRREIRIDPTRQLNINSGVTFLSDVTMHHMSWIRSDVQKKIRNSTARVNIERSTILTDYCQAKPGYYCEFYKAKLEACENLFNIPRIVDDGICTQINTPQV